MLHEFRRYIESDILTARNESILLAVSGGIDSMVMAHLFVKLGMKSGIAHCNFCLRGEDSDRDEEFVRDFAHKNKLPFFSERFSTKEYARNKSISVQMAARELRYEWFERIREENNYDRIAVAHNMNDNIETILLNLIRGTGLTGLTGIKPVAGKIIRPLLFASRQKIEKFCNDNGITFREDKSNAETKYSRNKIRHLVIPLLKEINPSIEESLTETSLILSDTDKILSEYITRIRLESSSEDRRGISYDIEKLNSFKPGRTLLFEIFKPYGINGAIAGDLLNILSSKSGKQVITKTHRITKNRNRLLITPFDKLRPFQCEIKIPEDLSYVPGVEEVKIMEKHPGIKIPEERHIAYIDLDKIIFPMAVRYWKRGDYFYPLGMKERKKLSDYFIDRKYALQEKEKALILESGGNVVWIFGERIDDRYKITKSTSKILSIRVLPCRS